MSVCRSSARQHRSFSEFCIGCVMLFTRNTVYTLPIHRYRTRFTDDFEPVHHFWRRYFIWYNLSFPGFCSLRVTWNSLYAFNYPYKDDNLHFSFWWIYRPLYNSIFPGFCFFVLYVIHLLFHAYITQTTIQTKMQCYFGF